MPVPLFVSAREARPDASVRLASPQWPVRLCPLSILPPPPQQQQQQQQQQLNWNWTLQLKHHHHWNQLRRIEELKCEREWMGEIISTRCSSSSRSTQSAPPERSGGRLQQNYCQCASLYSFSRIFGLEAGRSVACVPYALHMPCPPAHVSRQHTCLGPHTVCARLSRTGLDGTGLAWQCTIVCTNKY